ncbi:MAG: hypothetical protein AB8G86_17765, partial [Saprospiraceae bacterium]
GLWYTVCSDFYRRFIVKLLNSVIHHYFSCGWQVFLGGNTRQRRVNTGCGLQVLTSILEFSSLYFTVHDVKLILLLF